MAMQLLLVRHGESVGNVSRRLQAREDPLTDRGRRQAREIATALAERTDLRALYASPLARAFETAQIIGEALGIAPIPLGGLAEINVGEAAGLTFDEWVAQDPEGAARFQADGPSFIWPGGESGLQHQLHNCSLTEITIDPDEQAVSFVCNNEISHLSPEPEEEVALGQVAE